MVLSTGAWFRSYVWFGACIKTNVYLLKRDKIRKIISAKLVIQNTSICPDLPLPVCPILPPPWSPYLFPSVQIFTPHPNLPSCQNQPLQSKSTRYVEIYPLPVPMPHLCPNDPPSCPNFPRQSKSTDCCWVPPILPRSPCPHLHLWTFPSAETAIFRWQSRHTFDRKILSHS